MTDVIDTTGQAPLPPQPPFMPAVAAPAAPDEPLITLIFDATGNDAPDDSDDDDTAYASSEGALVPVPPVPPPPPPPPSSAPPPVPPVPEAAWQMLLDRDDDGRVKSTMHNAKVYLDYHPDFRGTIRWNEYAKKIEIWGGVLAADKDKSADVIVSSAQDYLAHVFGINIAYADLARRIISVAKKNAYDPQIQWLNSLAARWDGQSRIDNLFIDYFGAGTIASDTPTQEEQQRLVHLRRISRCWLLGAIERALRPGCKVDNVLILEGSQGQRKTSALEALGGKWYCSTQINLGDKDSKMIAAANWFVDMPDDKFMHAKNKGFITMRVDTFRPPFAASVESTPRRCIFIGSVNPDGGGYLDDPTGNRRYWPVKCGKIDLQKLMDDRDQIWAEAMAVALASETCPDCLASRDTVEGQRPRCENHRWWLDSDGEKEAAKETVEREEEVPLKRRIHEWWLDMEPSKRPSNFSTETVAEALGLETEALARSNGLATVIGLGVRSLGFKKKQISIAGVKHWVYVPTPELASASRVAKPTRSFLEVVPGGKR